MSHYFKNDPGLKSEESIYYVDVLGQTFSFYTDHGVFSKSHLDTGSRALIEYLNIPDHAKTLLDIGSGIGVIGIILKKVYPSLDVTQVDINHRALELNKKNAHINHVETTIIESDLFSALKENYDVIVSNPPIRAGKKVLHALYELAYKHLNTNGELWIVVRKDQGAKSTIDYLKTIYPQVSLIKRHKGFYVICAIK